MKLHPSHLLRAACGVLVFAACAPTARCGEQAITLQNPGFESGLDGWTAPKADFGMSAVLADAAHSGAQGLRVSDADNKKGSSLASARFDVTVGATYEVRFWGRCVSGSGLGVYLQFFDVGGNKLTDLEDPKGGTERINVLKVSVPPRATAWQPFTLRAVAPANSVYAYVWVHSSVNGISVTDLDDFELVKVN